MRFEEAEKIVRKNGADMRHPNMPKGYIIFCDEGKLVSYNPFNADKNAFTPTEEDLTRIDWIAGCGLAAL
jgi:hypothetical protein